ncbi:M50 family metallopeptidase [Saccharothrix hoggarensis]|uniref:M50 family metallopeptidase n=1 Tax=Saccharothrix hoggarensis TaxID=913853 RepID=A0ABW3R448_9PSEU
MSDDDVWWVTVPTALPQWWIPLTTGVIALLVSAAAVLPRVTWPRRVAFAFNVVGTIAHEFGHAAGGVVTGGGVHLIQVHTPHSGIAYTWHYSRFSAFVISAAGYATPPLAGLGAASLLSRGHAPMLLVLTIAAMILILVVTRDLITLAGVVAVGAVAALALYSKIEWLQHWIAYTETWILLFSEVIGIWVLVMRRVRGRIDDDDADGLADITGIPGVVWIAAWAVLIGWALWTAIPLMWP